ncbi:M15 family metallopeptidase [Paeniglutamicibacter sp. NPDC012692]|uniref:M15 family metallopeptidase n=1 Tax=Paeniglutamicibacter sp. NPDC012692 TaxID=3364388 RepID=UPI0036CBA090
MATSQNGWPVLSGSSAFLQNFEPITGKLRGGDVNTIFTWLATEYEKRVEPITKTHSWGFAPRPIRGGTTPSNHASGTAVDFNAPKHPLGVSPAKTMTKEQIAACKAIAKESAGVLRWGGTYLLRKDTMHWELNASAAKVSAFADKIREGQVKPKPSKPEKVVIKSNLTAEVKAKLKKMGFAKQDANAVRTFQKQHGLFEDGSWGTKTEAKYQTNIKLQKALNKLKSTTAKLAVDGYIGKPSEARIADILHRNGWKRPDLAASLKKIGAW